MRVHAERLAEIVARNRFAIVELVTRDQTLSVRIFVEQMQGACEIDACDVVLPLLFLVLVEPVTQIQNVVRRDDPLSSENVDGIRERPGL